MRLLLVESEKRMLPFVRELLSSFADEVLVTHAGEPDAATTSSSETDLIVVARDVWSDDDTELCTLLHAQRPAQPLLAISGPCEAQRRAAALRAGADDFLAVPFDIEELVARAVALVRRATSGSRYVRFGVFRLDHARRQVIVDGVEVLLTLREYDLLAMLIERSGEVVTRQELARQMTPGAAPGDSNAVDVHMSRIRDKLGVHAEAIQTVRRIGYRLRPSDAGSR